MTEYAYFFKIVTGILSNDGPLLGNLLNNSSISAAKLSKKRNELDGRDLASKHDKGFPDWGIFC